MKTFFAIVLTIMISTDPKEIAKINALKKEATAAYLSQDYELALSKYTLLHDSLGIDDPAITLNLAHAHYHLGDTAGAKMNYSKLTSSDSKKLKSIALQQLGVMNKETGKLKEALQQFKSSIKSDPSNKKSIYNYEVVKKLLEEQQKQDDKNKDKDDKNKDGEDKQDKKDQEEKKDGEEENKEKKDGENQEKSEQEKKEEQEQKEQEKKDGEEQDEEQEKSQEQMTKEKLKEMGISEEKARQLLEAMKQSEIKYLQQQQRKPTKRPPSGKPDW